MKGFVLVIALFGVLLFGCTGGVGRSSVTAANGGGAGVGPSQFGQGVGNALALGLNASDVDAVGNDVLNASSDLGSDSGISDAELNQTIG